MTRQNVLADFIPDGIFLGVSLVLRRNGRFLYGLRPPREEGKRIIVEITGIGGGVEPEDASFSAAALREAQEEMDCGVRLLPSDETVIVRGPGQIERVRLAGEERPLAVVFRNFHTPPHQPWQPGRGAGCIVVFLAELSGDPRPAMELPALLWLDPCHIVQTGRQDVLLGDLLVNGATLVQDQSTTAFMPGQWARLTDSQEALALALAENAGSFYATLAF